ncbi:hypothetical protein ABZ477_15915 [Microbacterium sp. NPDC019599]|uniref:hypothetical protein n=1 Tax=Microbacterium sp. NPDC019599 TaxID=3154690 RepID=UPI0033DE2109
MGDLEIRSGGVVAVDTASLRAAADRLRRLGQELDDVATMYRRAAAQMNAVPGADTIYADSRTLFLQTRAADAGDSTRDLGGTLTGLAAVYEAVELRAERAAAEAAGDSAAIRRIDARLSALEHDHPWTGLKASWQQGLYGALWSSDLLLQTPALSWLLTPAGPHAMAGAGIAAAAMTGLIRGERLGIIERGERLTGVADAVRVRALPTAVGPVAAPESLAAAAARIPSSEAGRVRVERYAMPDGSRWFAVYVRGTTSGTWGKTDAFDVKSDIELYGGKRSASYAATLAALRDAGAKPGDVVHAFGHSQGAMIASWLAVDGGYDTRTLVTFGSPVEAEVGSDTLSVAVRHTDDPVAGLQGGGLDTQVGSAGSFVAERLVDPLPSQADVEFGVHHVTAYEETAAMLDGSSDPRMDGVRQVFEELEGAASVEVTEYSAERVSPSGEDGLVSPSCGDGG